MGGYDIYRLPDWGPLVLSHAKQMQQGALEALLQLDQCLYRIVSTVSEPALGQLRMAWWRDEILRQRSPGALAPPDPLLQSILLHWKDDSGELVALIDGWEHLLFEQPLDEEGQVAFTSGRAKAFAAVARLSGKPDAAGRAARHGLAWAAADLAIAGHSTQEVVPDLPVLPRELRPLAIIGGLSRRSIKRGGAPLFGDRFSPLVALRLGFFGT